MKYEAIGKFLKDDIPKDKMSLQSIEEVLRRKYKDKLGEILSLNPSYIFFKKLTGRARTTLGMEVTDRRTLAVDPSMFSLGLLGHLNYRELEFTEEGVFSNESIPANQHYIVNQDTGGAIKGTAVPTYFGVAASKGKKWRGTCVTQQN